MDRRAAGRAGRDPHGVTVVLDDAPVGTAAGVTNLEAYRRRTVSEQAPESVGAPPSAPRRRPRNGPRPKPRQLALPLLQDARAVDLLDPGDFLAPESEW